MEKTLSDKIKFLRKKNNLSQDDFSKTFDISRSTLALIESDKAFPSYELVKKMSDYFKLSPSYFYDPPPELNQAISLRNNILADLKKESKNLFEIYADLETINYLSSSLREFLPTISFEDINDFTKYPKQLPGTHPLKLDYNAVFANTLDHLKTLENYKAAIEKFHDQLTNFLAVMKPLDKDNKLPNFNPKFWPKDI